MKKQYTKPQIMFESFTLCTNIAAGCAKGADGHADFHSCGFFFEGVGEIFTADWLGCRINEVVTGVNGDYNGICYDVPIENQNLFNS